MFLRTGLRYIQQNPKKRLKGISTGEIGEMPVILRKIVNVIKIDKCPTR